jgi:hypothetical protein
MDAKAARFLHLAQLTGKDTTMPARIFYVVGFALIVLGCASQVSADFCCGIFTSIAKDTKRRQCWPDPFAGPDRTAARAPFATMVANGWRRQNMMSDFYFSPSTGELTEAGKQKVRWILTVGPQQHRVLYVHTALTEQETAARLAAVQELASQISPNNLPPVLATSISDAGWPAAEVDAISRKYMSSTPVPRLSAPASGGSAGGSSSGGAQ